MSQSVQWLSPAVGRLIDLALDEDLGRGDVTTDATVGPDVRAVGMIVAREPVVVAGLAVAAEVFRRLEASAIIEPLVADGDELPIGGQLLRVAGSARALLRAERTALNFLQRLSGIATTTRSFVKATAGTLARIADTRKTYPGARPLEKLAVRAGGGSNHRHDLGSGVLIKDNHLAVAGSLTAAVRQARAAAPHGMKIEVEVDTFEQLDEALAVGADIVLLDNFSDADVARAVKRAEAVRPRPLLEVSGGVTLDRVPELAATGVDILSVGALTHSARAVDLSLELTLHAVAQAPVALGPAVVAETVPPSLPEGLAPDLAPERFLPLLRTTRLGRQYQPLALCGSTNDVCARQAREGAAEGLLVLADSQTGGRGRLGRSWFSPPGQNLYFSLLLRPSVPIQALPPLTLVAGAAVAEVVNQTLTARRPGSGLRARLKWPNDLLVDFPQNPDRVPHLPRGGTSPPQAGRPAWGPRGGGPACAPREDGPVARKLVGILTEMATEREQIRHVVLGIGVDVNQTEFPPELADRATSLRLCSGRGDSIGDPLDRAALLAAITNALEAAYDRALADGGAASLASWRELAALPRRCRVERAGEHLDGIALDVDGDGALLVQDGAGRLHRVLSGELVPL